MDEPITSSNNQRANFGFYSYFHSGKSAIKENLIATKDIDKMPSFLRIKSIVKFLLYGEIVEN